MSDVKKVVPLDPSKVQKGDLMTFVYFAKVERVDDKGAELALTNLDTNDTFRVLGNDLVKLAFSADRYDHVEKVTPTELIDILMRSYNRPFTVSFDKEDGKTRILRGRLIEPDSRRGRSHVEDLDLPGPTEKRMRQVNHRALHYIIVDGVKYEAK